MSVYIEREFQLPEIDYASLLTKEECENAEEYIPSPLMFRDLYPNCWYLRTPGDEDGTVALAEENYVADDFAEVNWDDYGPFNDDEDSTDNKFGTGNRPALYFKTSLLDAGAELGSGIRIGNERFTVIAEKIALCDSYISVDIFDEKTNDYEESDIKERVDKWFNGIKNMLLN